MIKQKELVKIMRALFAISSMFLLIMLSTPSIAQAEPEPEVGVNCDSPSPVIDNSPREYYNYRAPVSCTLSNDNAYQVEVETGIQWAHQHDHSTSETIDIDANSEYNIIIYLDAGGTGSTTPPGVETFTFESTVKSYAGIRECANCETTSDSLDVQILEWATVDFGKLNSESPDGTFGLDDLYEFQSCGEATEYSFSALVTAEANHDNINPAIGYLHDYYFYGSFPSEEEIKVTEPEFQQLNIKAGESINVDATFSVEVFENRTEDIYIIFVAIVGESEDVNIAIEQNSIDDGDGNYLNIDTLIGGCFIEGEYDQFPIDDNEPIIIETSSDDSQIYLIAGIGVATTICLIIVLLFMLLRNREK